MKTEKEEIVYQGKMIEVVHESFLSNGKEIILEKGRRSPGVRIIIETPTGEFLISKEERPNIGIDYRLPGGKVFDSLIEYNEFLTQTKNPDEIFEKAKKAAIKEAIEEVSIKPTEIELLVKTNCGASFEWGFVLFCCKKI